MELRVDVEKNEVEVRGSHSFPRETRRAILSTKETQIVDALKQANGRILSREEIYRKVWATTQTPDPYYDPASNVIDVYFYYIRRCLRQLGLSKSEARTLITQIRGVGYRLVELNEDGTPANQDSWQPPEEIPEPRRPRGRPKLEKKNGTYVDPSTYKGEKRTPHGPKPSLR